MVWLAEKPSLRAASCCSVDVVKGGGGLRVSGLVSTLSTLNCPASTSALAASALPSSPSVSFSTFSPFQRIRRAVKFLPSCPISADTDQYSWEIGRPSCRERGG